MIRRDYEFPSGEPGWMLISQVEHARVSGELATACRWEILFNSVDVGLPWSRPAEAWLQHQVLAAVVHHDDGWNDWECAPQVDPQTGRPLAYTELSALEATKIWTRSIESALKFGPLAGATVAGHFLRLLGFAEHLRNDPVARRWTQEMAARRDGLLDQLQSDVPKTSMKQVGARALEWLWTFDEISLWLCCDRPPGDEDAATEIFKRPYLAGNGAPLEMRLSQTSPSDRHAARAPGQRGGPARLIAEPWLFTRERFDFSISGVVVTQAAVAAGGAWLAAAEPSELAITLSQA